ncbi:hypothetical protein HT746_14970 [Burkholderia pyrrocinia]|uniref:hypothetical protein n=1 Tax=Burkholderia pyrrocinia TaxID=60550 RepID=UPI001575D276|nr:hypothetical protein [Burkholderia pyrrocinia]NTX28418.1 hypothetical protein [Burkholderia pyrrocinia]
MSDMATDRVAGMTLTAMVAESVARCRPVTESGSVGRFGTRFGASLPAAMFGRRTGVIRHDAQLRMKLLYRNGFRQARV